MGWDFSEPIVWNVEAIVKGKLRDDVLAMPWESYVVYPVGVQGWHAEQEYDASLEE